MAGVSVKPGGYILRAVWCKEKTRDDGSTYTYGNYTILSTNSGRALDVKYFGAGEEFVIYIPEDGQLVLDDCKVILIPYSAN